MDVNDFIDKTDLARTSFISHADTNFGSSGVFCWISNWQICNDTSFLKPNRFFLTNGTFVENCTRFTTWVCVCVCVQSCLTLYDLMDCRPPGFSVHGVLQARILEWFATSFARGSSPGLKPTSSASPALAGWFLTTWATWEAPTVLRSSLKFSLWPCLARLAQYC